MNVNELHEANRAAWNEAAEHYEKQVERDIAFLRGGGKNLLPPELEFLKDLGSWCGRAIHLQCAGGRDTLSLWNHGAREVVGVDISERMIACARRKSEALAAPASWHCCDVLRTPHELDRTADLVYTGRGALCWILDIDAWAAVVARLLKPGAKLYIFEGHPLSWVWDENAETFKLHPRYGDYFSAEIQVDQGWSPQHIGNMGRPVEEHARKYERQWTIAHVLNALTGAGLLLVRLEEHPDLYWNSLPNMAPEMIRRLPQTYSLLMRQT